MNNNKLVSLVRRSLAATTLASLAVCAMAQESKTIVVEHVPAFPAFGQWVSTFVMVQPEPALTRIETVPFALSRATPDENYQPLPVILGAPELPLIGSGAAQSARAWGQALNYQGLHMRQVVLNAKGNKRELRPMGSPLRAGERFKIRVTATFDAVADVDQELGDPWYGKRTGQVYPQAGVSVQMKAGESVDLPLGAHEYFTMNRAANERLVVAVRHAGAVGSARSEQPAYRQDGKTGSNYLQLVPRGTFPAVEQQIAQAR